MPGLVKKLLIFAAADGLLLQPAPPRNHPPATTQTLKIDFKGNIAPLLHDRRDEVTAATALEAHGILGLFHIASTAFLIAIASREQVAQIRGKPIYVVTDVVLIPLSSQQEAAKVITTARDQLKRKQRLAHIPDDSDSDPDQASDTVSDNVSIADLIPENPSGSSQPPGQHKRQTSVAEDVFEKKGVYGRFVGNWFSQKGWSDDKRRAQGLTSEEDLRLKKQTDPQTAPVQIEEEEKAKAEDGAGAAGTQGDSFAGQGEQLQPPPPEPVQDIPNALEGQTDHTTIALLPKLLRTTKIYFGSRSFYYSYDYDLSRRLDKQIPSGSSQPLFQQYDPLFFWNAHLMRPFIQSGQVNFVIPAIQGFVGQRSFTVDVSTNPSASSVVDSSSKPVGFPSEQNEDVSLEVAPEEPGTKDLLLTLISRRSIKRAGLRYLRRGVDEEGNVANNVETEQLLSTPTWDTSRNQIFSFTQIRGSIPLFFSQSPYSLKPWPELYGSPEATDAAFRQHFSNLMARYGKVQATCLVDKHGSERKIGEIFEKNVARMNASGGMDGKGNELLFEWFDFHQVCRGMKFENVSILMDSLAPILGPFGWSVQDSTGFRSIQSGVLRTNCMDCLDRTNVVQSATARAALEAQLAEQNIRIDLQKDPKTSWFNTLWADNGDAVSRQYSGTAALKGDYTRTRQRQLSGAFTDLGLTLTRYYGNIINDWFAQAVIDYLLGRATESTFTDFEADMKTQDYAIDLRKVRQTAIARSAEIVIESEDEDLIHGWALTCPSESNTIRTIPFEECVLLLTDRALYFCRLDWSTEKVKEFERVEFESIQAIEKGAYVTSTLAKRDMDEAKNVGFLLRIDMGVKRLVRVNTRSLDNSAADVKDSGKKGYGSRGSLVNDILSSGLRVLAFKALPATSSLALDKDDADGKGKAMTEVQSVRLICDEIVRVANRARKSADGDDLGELVVEEKDIISLATAKKSTGYIEQIGYSLKKLVWAS